MSDNEENKRMGRRHYFKNFDLKKYKDKIVNYRNNHMGNIDPETGQYKYVPNKEFDNSSLC